jgi:3-methyladenine DNA glycosylase AlkD
VWAVRAVTPMEVSTERQRLLAEIRAAADPHYAGLIKRNIPSDLAVHGLRISDIRRIVREWRRDRQDASVPALLDLADSLWRGESREERLVALELVQQHTGLVHELDWRRLDRWRRELDNWELTDVLGLYVLGPWVALNRQDRERHLWTLLQQESIWSRRLSLIAGMAAARTEKRGEIPAISLRLVDRVSHVREPLMVKAISWALRDFGKRHPEQIARYLHDNCDVLDPQVIREVTNKLETGRKDGRPRD